MAEKRRVLSVYELGDMKACYVITEGGCPELILFPGDVDASDPDALAEEQSWSGEDGLLKEGGGGGGGGGRSACRRKAWCRQS